MGNRINKHNSDNHRADSKYNFIEPDMNKGIPILNDYCGNRDNISNSYHCRNLERVLFRCANFNNYKGDYYFTTVTSGIVDKGDLEKDTRRDISYHLNYIMQYSEKPSTIIKTCKDFENLCISFCNNSTTTNQSTTNISVNNTTNIPIDNSTVNDSTNIPTDNSTVDMKSTNNFINNTK